MEEVKFETEEEIHSPENFPSNQPFPRTSSGFESPTLKLVGMSSPIILLIETLSEHYIVFVIAV